MRTIYLSILFIFLGTQLLFAQKSKRVSKNHFGFELSLGTTFPHFDLEQDQWKALYYSGNSFTFLWSNRLNRHWIADFGIGVSTYLMFNQGPVDLYILDFISPHFMTGISYNQTINRNKESFYKISFGSQLGYRGELTQTFKTYKVEIESKNQFYFFVRPEVGIRNKFKKKIKNSPFQLSYELGTFFRLNFNRLGKATFTQDDLKFSIRPKGDVIGIYFKLLIPAGKRKVKLKIPKFKPQNPHNTRNL